LTDFFKIVPFLSLQVTVKRNQRRLQELGISTTAAMLKFKEESELSYMFKT